LLNLHTLKRNDVSGQSDSYEHLIRVCCDELKKLSSSWESHLRTTGCHQGTVSHNFTCTPRLNPNQFKAGTRFTYPGGMEG